ncbi:hypothetical protein EFA69_04445 [Rufibacter immobilis]|uniref:Uncharacterized protein n=2 Tax=Rufibacter immobilis TaxID=1348778 RepID=A0A3M9N5V8_9BACT|nr:hypothetical protein EFA69_04445 [Rufibacter immobilis]
MNYKPYYTMENDNKYNEKEKLPQGKETAGDLKQTPEEPGAGTNDKASFQQGGQQPGNSQGGQGGSTADGEKNSRHDSGDEMSVFGRMDS